MNRRILQIILAIGLIFSVVGCTKSAPSKQKTKVKPTKDAQGRPLWVSTPNMNGYIGVVSVVSKKKIKNPKKLRYVAKMKARSAFQTRKGTKIDSSSATKTKMDGSMDYKEKIKISSTHIQTKKLVVKKIYEDKENFYMWMVVDK